MNELFKKYNDLKKIVAIEEAMNNINSEFGEEHFTYEFHRD